MADIFSVNLNILGSDVKQIILGNAQDRGSRPYQEDSFGYTPLDKAGKEGFSAVVADGMGGLAAGDKVSAYAVSGLLSMGGRIKGKMPVHLEFAKLISEINRSVVYGGSGGGCTFAAVYCCRSGVYWCSVGDSRIYIFRGGLLFQLSEDGDYQNQLLDDVIAEEMTFEEMMENEKKDSLVQYIGSTSEIVPDMNIRPLLPSSGDKLLICSDGVYNALSVEEMEQAMQYPAHQAADALLSFIKSKNYDNQDNNTSIVLEFV